MNGNQNSKLKKFIFGILILILVIFLCLFIFPEVVGTWGINKTVGWAWDFTNIVWWLGILTPILGLILLFILVRKLIKYFRR